MTEQRQEIKLREYQRILSKNSVSVYLKEIDRIPLLSREEELDYATKAAEGDTKSKEMLIVSNLRFVVSIAKKYHGNGIPLSDLISEGNLGLITAVDKFDYRKGFHFISYAVWWIRQSIMKAISEKSRMVRLPMNRANELMSIGKFVEDYSKKHGVQPSEDMISSELSIGKSEIRKLRDIAASQSSIEDLIMDESRDNEPSAADMYSIVSEEHPDNQVIFTSLRENIDRLLSRLTEREKEIIENRFGLNGKEPQSLNKIGKKMNLTKERIRQIEKTAIKQIREHAVNEGLNSYLN